MSYLIDIMKTRHNIQFFSNKIPDRELVDSILKKAAKFKYFKPCVKHYLSNNVKSRLARVPAPEWEIATFLPTADFQKSGKSSVYRDSRKMI